MYNRKRFFLPSQYVEYWLQATFYRYGDFVGRYPLPFLILPLILTAVLSTGLMKARMEQDVQTLYTPVNAPSRREFVAATLFGEWGHNWNRKNSATDNSNVNGTITTTAAPTVTANPTTSNTVTGFAVYGVQIYFVAKKPASTKKIFNNNYDENGEEAKKNVDPDEENMLTPNRTKFVIDFFNYVTKHFQYTYKGEKYYFGKRLCERSPFCMFVNRPIMTFLLTYREKSITNNPNYHLSFPVLDLWGVHFFLGYNIIGVPRNELRSGMIGERSINTTSNNSEIASADSSAAINNSTNYFHTAKLLRLGFPVESWMSNCTVEEFRAFRLALEKYIASQQGQQNVEIVMMTSEVAEHELFRNATACLPYLLVSVIAVVLYISLSSATSNNVRITGKTVEAMLGCVACLMAIISTLGLCFYAGLAFNATVSVMPFLALAIGVDDTFLALAVWYQTDPKLPPNKRLAESMRDSATAITVTSLTDVVLFGLCAISSTPAITLFGIFTATAMAFDYLYQLTFFAAVMTYAGRREAARRHCCLPGCCYAVKICGKSKSEPSKLDGDNMEKALKSSVLETKPQSELQQIFRAIQKKLSLEKNSAIGGGGGDQSINFDEPFVARLIRTKLAPILTKPLTKIIVMLIYILYLFTAGYGLINTKMDMSVRKVYMDESPMRRYFEIQQNYLWSSMLPRVYVLNPPDFRNVSEQEKFDAFLDYLESSEFSSGPGSSISWYRAFKEHIQFIDITPDQFYNGVKLFLEVNVHAYYKGDLRWGPEKLPYYDLDDTNEKITVFAFSAGFSVGDGGSWDSRLQMLKSWRQICARYPEYNLTIFDGDSFYIDQYNTLDTETVQQVGIGILGMTIMAIIFIPSASSVFWVGFTLLSMDFGVIGYLMLWGCDLDPISMINIVMSLDFAVEYAAHICHRYYSSSEITGNEKLLDTLSAIGWPVLQGAVSALIAVAPLGLVQSYIVRTFFRTVVLVVGLGLFHAFVLLPVIVSSVSMERHVPIKSVAKIRSEKRPYKFIIF